MAGHRSGGPPRKAMSLLLSCFSTLGKSMSMVEMNMAGHRSGGPLREGTSLLSSCFSTLGTSTSMVEILSTVRQHSH
ncbi:hypothetical protein DER46DRAFT_611537 [Fusarium sp. MPI-SDFR-AT-0072]|nr:hypothetical protein DER46DRAFT_611537 [Fusarium sp. MPI-SDFR-AT-0072]